jgi:hypothetical protein
MHKACRDGICRPCTVLLLHLLEFIILCAATVLVSGRQQQHLLLRAAEYLRPSLGRPAKVIDHYAFHLCLCCDMHWPAAY